ncbi:OsmC family protein, partial [Vicingaceae bacterium]|nr:OsmC family protein [Vicingaceae bacterium]
MFPHQYTARASVQTEGNVSLSGDGLPNLESAPPVAFQGPGDQWSPEDLLMGAVADCFALSFRAIAAASKLDWNDLQISVTGTLDRVDRVVSFTTIEITAHLKIPTETDKDKADRMLHKAE